MSTTNVTLESLQAEIDSLKSTLAKFTNEHAEFRSVHVSRRGVAGPKGDPGASGRDGADSTVPGPAGRDGRDADVAEVVQAAKQQMQADLAAFQARLSSAIVAELKTAGVVDENGEAILIPGKDGVDGKDSTVAGPKGDKGDSITGAPGTNGRDAQVAIGNVISGDEAGVSVRVVDGVSYLDFVLPRGERGITGERGSDGADSTVAGPAGENGKDGAISQSDIANMEAKLRSIWKSDIQIALRHAQQHIS